MDLPDVDISVYMESYNPGLLIAASSRLASGAEQFLFAGIGCGWVSSTCQLKVCPGFEVNSDPGFEVNSDERHVPLVYLAMPNHGGIWMLHRRVWPSCYRAWRLLSKREAGLERYA